MYFIFRCKLITQKTHTYGSHILLHCLEVSDTFNSLCKVLFIVPSRYFFSIGLRKIFNRWWNIPPNSRSNSKERYSIVLTLFEQTSDETGFSPSVILLSKRFSSNIYSIVRTLDYNSSKYTRLTVWVFLSSFAITRRILFSFFLHN